MEKFFDSAHPLSYVTLQIMILMEVTKQEKEREREREQNYIQRKHFSIWYNAYMALWEYLKVVVALRDSLRSIGEWFLSYLFEEGKIIP